jgi:hypothetical protein
LESYQNDLFSSTAKEEIENISGINPYKEIAAVRDKVEMSYTDKNKRVKIIDFPDSGVAQLMGLE